MGTLGEFRGWLRLDMNDPAGADQRFSDADLDRAVGRAVAELTSAAPRETDSEHVCAVASRTLDLGGAPYAGQLLDVSEVEVPYGAGGAAATYPPGLVAFRLSADRTKLLLMVAEVPAAGQVVRLRWSSAYAITASATTVPPALDPLLTLGAAGYAMLAYSTPSADNFKYEDGATAAGVDDSMIPREWRARSDALLERFHAGLEGLRRQRLHTGRPWVSWSLPEAGPRWPAGQPGREP